MAGLLLILLQAWGAECSAEAELGAAEEAILSLELDAGTRHLEAVEQAFGCGVASAEEVARFWLLTAGLASFNDDGAVRAEAFVAARAADPDFWLEALGADLRAEWEGAVPPQGRSRILLTPAPTGHTVRVDGSIVSGEIELAPGLHVIQVYTGTDGFGRVVRVDSGQAVTLATKLPASTPTPSPDPVSEPESNASPEPIVPPEPSLPPEASSTGPALFFGLGIQASLGEAWRSLDVQEPAARVGPHLEAGVVVRAPGAWFRAVAAGEVLLGGRFLYLKQGDGGTEAVGLLVSPSVLAAGGITVAERVDLGIQAGVQLPSRVPLRGVGSIGLGSTFRLEGRVGANLVGEKTVVGENVTTTTRVQPAFDALLTAAF